LSENGGMDIELVVTQDAEAAARAAAVLLVEVAEAGGSVVLSGGSTPRRAYELAAAAHSDWGGVDVWFGDDRCVPADDPGSNQLLVRESLLEWLVVEPTVHAIATELSAAEAAAAYDAALQGEPLDLVLLGLGPDGHTASLFPGAPTLDVRDRLAVAAEPGLEPFVERVTLTIPALEAGTHVVFLAVGEEKAAAVRRAFVDEASRMTPASLVRSRHGTTTVILDEAAASLLG
jgi:6-phosphogluconolactonase